MPAFSGLLSALLKHAAIVVQLELDLARLHAEGLGLALVVLKREATAGSNEQDLPDVLRGLCPDLLVTPGLFDPPHGAFATTRPCVPSARSSVGIAS